MRWWSWHKAKGGEASAGSAYGTPAGRVHPGEYYIRDRGTAERWKDSNPTANVYYWQEGPAGSRGMWVGVWPQSWARPADD